MAVGALFLGLASETGPLSEPVQGTLCYAWRGQEEPEERDGQRRRRKDGVGEGESSIKPAVNFHPTCGDTEGVKRWIKRCR